jgi:hypothetical protein
MPPGGRPVGQTEAVSTTDESLPDPTYGVVWPRSPRGVQRRRRADRLDSLDGRRIAFLWDHLFRGDELFPVLAEELRRRFPDIDIVDHTEFGNLHGADEPVRMGRLPDDLRSRGVDAVVSGMGC